MTRTWILRLSFLLNLLFCGACAWWLTGREQAGPPAIVKAAPELPKTPLPEPPPPFQWSQLEANDYPTYITNLRAIGCPEETIRDIITAEVASLYTEKRRQIETAQTHFQNKTPLPRQSTASQQPGRTTLQIQVSTRGTASRESSVTSNLNERTVQAMTVEEARLLARLLPPRPSAVKDATDSPIHGMPGEKNKEAAPATVTPIQQTAAADANKAMPQSAPARSGGFNAMPTAEEEELPRPLLTRQQALLRSKIGWQAFYSMTSEEESEALAQIR
ncbi:MAG: hypothetical protein V4710_06005 [Verrucomicrobiota bacterium]